MVEIGAGHDDVHALLQLLRLIEERLAARRDRMGELPHELPDRPAASRGRPS